MNFTIDVEILIPECTDNDNLISNTKWSICKIITHNVLDIENSTALELKIIQVNKVFQLFLASYFQAMLLPQANNLRNVIHQWSATNGQIWSTNYEWNEKLQAKNAFRNWDFGSSPVKRSFSRALDECALAKWNRIKSENASNLFSFLCGSTSIAVDGFTLILCIPWPKRWLKYSYGTRFLSTVCLSHAYQIHSWTMYLLCHWQYRLVMHCSGHLNYCYIDRLDHCIRNVTQNTFCNEKIGFYR